MLSLAWKHISIIFEKVRIEYSGIINRSTYDCSPFHKQNFYISAIINFIRE